MVSNPTCDIFIDHKKVVDHEILVNKLYHYGFRAIRNDWFASYLKNRIYVLPTKDPFPVSCFFFKLYVKRMNQCSNKFRFYLFLPVIQKFEDT